MQEARMTAMRKLKIKWSDFVLALRLIDRAQIWIAICILPLAIFMLLPLIYLFNHAFKPLHELFMFPPTFIVRSRQRAVSELFAMTASTIVPVSRYVFNSIVVTLLSSVAMVITGAMCAYPLSKHPFPGSKMVLGLIMLSSLFATEAIAIPRFIVIQSLGIMNTYLGHVLPLVAMPVGVFLLKQFMDQVPTSWKSRRSMARKNSQFSCVSLCQSLHLPSQRFQSLLSNRHGERRDFNFIHAGRFHEDAPVLHEHINIWAK